MAGENGSWGQGGRGQWSRGLWSGPNGWVVRWADHWGTSGGGARGESGVQGWLLGAFLEDGEGWRGSRGQVLGGLARVREDHGESDTSGK